MAITIKGYAIVSADGFIADDQGRMPEVLRFEADWAYFQQALDAADVTLLGRHTHEAASNVKKRRRLIATRSVRAVVQEDVSTWWVNPREIEPTKAVAIVVGAEASVAVVGGTDVFGWILEEGGYDAFHLSVAHNVRLGAGRPLFDGVDDLKDALSKLQARGLHISSRSWLDEKAGLELLIIKPSDQS